MTQDNLILLLFKIVLIADLLSVFAFLVTYSALAQWWRHVIGRTIAIKDILLGMALLPTTLSLFFEFSRLTSRIAAWIDISLFGLIAVVMTWRCIIWVKIHRKGDGDAEGS